MRVLLYVYILIYQVHSRNKTRVSGSSVPVLGVKLKRGLYLPWLFFKIDLRSATAFMGSSRWDLLDDVAEQLNIGLSWKITKIHTTPVIVAHSKQV